MKKLRLRDEKRPRRAAEVEKRRGQEAAGAGISKEGRSAEVKDHLSLGFLDHHLQVLG